MNVQSTPFADSLLRWFDVHGRHRLPWQEDTTPYRVWVSEVMLQQTQVATVIPYFERFMTSFPNVRALACASLDEVLHRWTGLGYYARARNLHVCAKMVVELHGGEFPRGLEAMMALPGIGRSTAGAILAIASGQRHAILDGNVKRVLSRVFGVSGDPGSRQVLATLWLRSDSCTPHHRVGDYTQAIMDLGATLCTRASPACTVCPMSAECIAALEGRQAELPGAKKKKRFRPARETTLLIAQTGTDESAAVLLQRRPDKGVWGGLWSPPQFACQDDAIRWCVKELGAPHSSPEALEPIDHAFTHFDLRLHPVRVKCAATMPAVGQNRLWYQLSNPSRVGLPRPICQLLARLRNERTGGTSWLE